ncbi:DNA-directed DNA/RNA polymerase mu isoform X2 [Bombina bombina]|uniref:DNA-directed DNA/RNA polymerase mu isoform X2 n=1 Tax=Bombina bombina TaxID=8345 RepID=UPI00235A701D|nr:DNA-directed DNA/RNA polymerase mu isoform X2 [Bombina bombina]
MSLIPLKRRKKGGPITGSLTPPVTLFPEVCVFLVERRMGAARRNFLTVLAQGKGFCVTSEYSDAVTHIVSEQNTCSEVLAWIEKQTGRSVHYEKAEGTPHLLDVTWFTESMSAGKPVEVEPRHCLEGRISTDITHEPQDFLSGRSIMLDQTEECSPVSGKVSHNLSYACKRRTPLHHHNQEITDSLEVLARGASYQGSEEILEDGVCREVETMKNSEQYKTMELLTSIFGVGIRTAERWYKEGVRSLEDLQSADRNLTVEQRIGLQHYTDLQTPVTWEEAECAERLVTDVFYRFNPDVQVTMTGGFRRGKQHGHDVDFLITHPDERVLSGLLKTTVSYLNSKNFLLYHQMKKRSLNSHTLSSTMDGHETCYAIFALPVGFAKEDLEDITYKGTEKDLVNTQTDQVPKRWRAVRVDLVITPYVEYPYALLGWTGSKHFERELRRYAYHEKKMSLNSHGLYDQKRCSLPATSEEDIFAHLGLQYLPPSERNA